MSTASWATLEVNRNIFKGNVMKYGLRHSCPISMFCVDFSFVVSRILGSWFPGNRSTWPDGLLKL